MGISQFCGPILIKFILSEKKDYLITFLIAGAFCLCKIGVLLFFDHTEKINIDLEDLEEETEQKIANSDNVEEKKLSS